MNNMKYPYGVLYFGGEGYKIMTFIALVLNIFGKGIPD